ncbi:MAG: hypothetical protein FWG23_00255 [Eggerthellaceae bacterium]|nr:hypothetical protein [Eggerthellaceae bacterium]
MAFAGSLFAAILFSLIFKPLIKRFSIFFYVAALLLGVFYLVSISSELPGFLTRFLPLVMQKGTLAVSFFVIVMFIGVFDESSEVRKYLMPIRAELSIIGSLLMLTHIVRYLITYAPLIIGGARVGFNIFAAFFLALLLVVLLAILTGTSFNVTKRRIHPDSWKRIQWLAYPFFLLIYVHLLLFLLPSALLGGTTAWISVGVYTATFIAYIVLRLRRSKYANTSSPDIHDTSKDAWVAL